MNEYSFLPENTYNMDEKGFIIGRTGRSKGSLAELYRRESKSQTLFKIETGSGYQSWLVSTPAELLFPLALSQYSKKLTNHTHKSLGILPVKQSDFVPLFWSAYISSFTDKLIFKAFEATGIWPKNRDAVLKRFKHKPPTNPNEFTSLMESDWRRLRQVVKCVVKEGAENEAIQVTQALHHYQVQNDLLLSENQGLRESLATKKKHSIHGRKLHLP
jgi:hypothetical protein